MIAFKTKRHIFFFYGYLLFFSGLLLGMALRLGYLFWYRPLFTPRQSADYFLCLVAIGMILFAVYLVYKHYRAVPLIRINADTLHFDGRQYPLSAVIQFEPTGKRKFPMIGGMYHESALLQFGDGETLTIFDNMYHNTWQLKILVDQAVKGQQNGHISIITHVKRNDIAEEHFDSFKWNPVFSFRGLTLWGFIGLMLFLAFQTVPPGKAERFYVLIIFSISWFIVHLFLLFYISVSSAHLVLRNHYLPGWRKIYRMEDIREIVFEQIGRSPNGLRVITKDFKSRLYFAGTLRDKTWFALKARLEELGVKVRNEALSDLYWAAIFYSLNY